MSRHEEDENDMSDREDNNNTNENDDDEEEDDRKSRNLDLDSEPKSPKLNKKRAAAPKKSGDSKKKKSAAAAPKSLYPAGKPDEEAAIQKRKTREQAKRQLGRDVLPTIVTGEQAIDEMSKYKEAKLKCKNITLGGLAKQKLAVVYHIPHYTLEMVAAMRKGESNVHSHCIGTAWDQHGREHALIPVGAIPTDWYNASEIGSEFTMEQHREKLDQQIREDISPVEMYMTMPAHTKLGKIPSAELKKGATQQRLAELADVLPRIIIVETIRDRFRTRKNKTGTDEKQQQQQPNQQGEFEEMGQDEINATAAALDAKLLNGGNMPANASSGDWDAPIVSIERMLKELEKLQNDSISKLCQQLEPLENALGVENKSSLEEATVIERITLAMLKGTDEADAEKVIGFYRTKLLAALKSVDPDSALCPYKVAIEKAKVAKISGLKSFNPTIPLAIAAVVTVLRYLKPKELEQRKLFEESLRNYNVQHSLLLANFSRAQDEATRAKDEATRARADADKYKAELEELRKKQPTDTEKKAKRSIDTESATTAAATTTKSSKKNKTEPPPPPPRERTPEPEVTADDIF
jgi:hypothetical protein